MPHHLSSSRNPTTPSGVAVLETSGDFRFRQQLCPARSQLFRHQKEEVSYEGKTNGCEEEANPIVAQLWIPSTQSNKGKSRARVEPQASPLIPHPDSTHHPPPPPSLGGQCRGLVDFG